MLLRLYIYILSIILLGMILWGCNSTPINSGDVISTHTFENIPSSSMEQTIASLSENTMRYSCWITTLNEPGSDEKFSLHSSIHFFEDLENTSGWKNGKHESVNWSFVVTDKSVSSGRSNWRHNGHDNVIRRATCNLPNIPAVEKEMSRRLSEFGADHWLFDGNSSERYKVYSKKQKVKPVNDELMIGLSSTGGWYCSVYYITIVTINQIVVSVDIYCGEWSYETGGGGGGGLPWPPSSGGGGGDGSGGGDGGDDSCDPSVITCDGSTAEPCIWLWNAPPWMCGDPCQTGDNVIDDINVQQAMHEAWEQSYGFENSPLPHGQRNETMYIVTATSSGYEFQEIPPGPNTSSCHFSAPGAQVPSNAVGLIHTHPYGHGDTVNDPRCSSGWYNGNNVSSGDAALMQALINGGLNIPIYVIDKTKIRVIQPSNPSQYAQTINRCGY